MVHVGTGLMLVRRRVLTRLAELHPDLCVKGPDGVLAPLLFEPMIRDGARTGEDVAFCQRARDAGFKVEVMVDAEVNHAGVVDNLASEFPDGAHVVPASMATLLGATR